MKADMDVPTIVYDAVSHVRDTSARDICREITALEQRRRYAVQLSLVLDLLPFLGTLLARPRVPELSCRPDSIGYWQI